jgi:hypothetical protein
MPTNYIEVVVTNYTHITRVDVTKPITGTELVTVALLMLVVGFMLGRRFGRKLK